MPTGIPLLYNSGLLAAVICRSVLERKTGFTLIELISWPVPVFHSANVAYNAGVVVLLSPPI
jgi:hypothetical protein